MFYKAVILKLQSDIWKCRLVFRWDNKTRKTWISPLKTVRTILYWLKKMKVSKSKTFVVFPKKEIHSNKISEHCCLPSKYRRLTHQIIRINVTPKQSNFISFLLRHFGIYDCHLFFEKIIDEKKKDVNFDITPDTNEESSSLPYACFRFNDGFRSLFSILVKLVNTLVGNN